MALGSTFLQQIEIYSERQAIKNHSGCLCAAGAPAHPAKHPLSPTLLHTRPKSRATACFLQRSQIGKPSQRCLDTVPDKSCHIDEGCIHSAPCSVCKESIPIKNIEISITLLRPKKVICHFGGNLQCQHLLSIFSLALDVLFHPVAA